MKLILKIISFVLVGILFTSPTIASAANLNDEIQFINLGEGLEVSIKDNSVNRVVEYYENNIKKQKAILDKKSGDIFYYDLSEINTFSQHFSNKNESSTLYTTSYNISDFKQNIDVNQLNIVQDRSTAYLKSLTFTDGGDTYRRYLYGYKASTQYEETSWHFEAGIALAVILAAVGFLPGVNALIINAVGIAGGAILSALTVTEWIKDSYWVYIFNQETPTHINFTCSNHFTYEKQRRVEVNGDVGYWETFYTMPAWEIEYIRGDILQNPGLYY